MAKLIKALNPIITKYKDRQFDGTDEEYQYRLKTSPCLYIGNLSFYTTEEQLCELFSKVGAIDRIIMGLDKFRLTPCGFAFVIFQTREDAEAAVKYLNGATLDGRPVRVDYDWGFKDGRQYGRGKSGGQVRDEHRKNYDEGRGGYGKALATQVHQMQQAITVGGKRGREDAIEFEPAGRNPKLREDRGVEDDTFYVSKKRRHD